MRCIGFVDSTYVRPMASHVPPQWHDRMFPWKRGWTNEQKKYIYLYGFADPRGSHPQWRRLEITNDLKISQSSSDLGFRKWDRQFHSVVPRSLFLVPRSKTRFGETRSQGARIGSEVGVRQCQLNNRKWRSLSNPTISRLFVLVINDLYDLTTPIVTPRRVPILFFFLNGRSYAQAEKLSDPLTDATFIYCI